MRTSAKENGQEAYTSPEIKVVEVKVTQTICISVGGTQQYGGGSWNW